VSLTNKQKKWIENHKGKHSAEKLAKDLNVTKKEVDEYLDSIPKKPVKKSFYLALIIIPILFFVLLEAGLRIFNYGYDFTQWVNVTKGKLVLNTDIAHKYFFNTKSVPYSNQNAFDEVKTDSTFRVFVLGGSSAAGYPFLPIGSFSNYLQDRLSLVYPHSRIEVVNCSMTAVNSYTIRDLMPGILEQKPDLILIYAGHNEYYGALGVGSMENLGTSRTIVNAVISLERFKTFQLLRDVIKSGAKLLSGRKHITGTLMSRMAKNQFIGFNSDIYLKGLAQFEGNMTDVLKMAKEVNVPVILGTLSSNLKDQAPFVSISENGYPPADKIYNEAKDKLQQGSYSLADSLFKYARDLDALRFRAPGKMNKIIYKLGKEFNYPIANVDSTYNAVSPDNIVGNNIFTDQLHPTLAGYQLMGDIFFQSIQKYNFLPISKPLNISNRIQDSVTVANFSFCRLDSVIGKYRIKLLKNDWPFIEKDQKLPDYKVLQPRDHVDSVAAKFLVEDSNWEKAHRELAEWYATRKDMKSFLAVMNVLITQYPIILSYYDYTANVLMNNKMYDQAYTYLKKKYDLRPDSFSTKWIGIISLSRNNNQQAKKYLIESLNFNSKDAQVLYNLSGCYVGEGNFKKALETVNKALEINPGYNEAKALKAQLTAAIK